MKALLLAGLCLTSSAETAPKAHRAPGAWELKAGPSWLARDAWSGRYPSYLLFKPGAPPLARLSIEKFSRANRLYASGEAFLERLDDPATPLKRAGKIALSGKTVELWEREYPEPRTLFEPGEGPVAAITERLAVLAAPDGFYVLRWSAASAEFPALDPEFQSLLAAFRLLGAKG